MNDGVSNKVKDDMDSYLRASNETSTQELESPFLRMSCSNALKHYREQNIYKDPKAKMKFEFGDGIPEKRERERTDQISRPIMLIKFPASLKLFYM